MCLFPGSVSGGCEQLHLVEHGRQRKSEKIWSAHTKNTNILRNQNGKIRISDICIFAMVQ